MKDSSWSFDNYGRAGIAILSLAVAFVLSIELGERGVQFDLEEASVSANESKTAETSKSLSNLKIFNRALLKVKDNYVKPDRIQPPAMLESALDEIQRQLPEVVFDYRRKDDRLTSVEVAVGEQSKSFDLGELESLWEMSFRLKSIVSYIEKQTSPPQGKDFRDIEYAAINGMLSDLDPHSTLLSPKHYKEMKTQTGGEFGGLGIVISIRDGQLTVISPIDGTPAAGKGIKAKDKIVRINDRSTVNMKLNEAVQLLRGEPGTKVDIWVDREGWNEPRKFTVTRDVIEIQSVNSEPLSDKVGYVRIKNFQSNTFSDFKTHLKKLKKKMGGMGGLVLDLRDNPGGLLGQAIKISDLFLKEGTIVSTMGAGEKMRDKKVATEKGTEPNYPLVVLVNAGSASAAEIVSGSLQNHGRALVMGERTFGKGTVQVMYEFPDDSALKLTVAEYLTPGGVSIQSRGIAPDVRLIPAYVGEKPNEVNLFLSDNILREQDLESHLANGEDKGSSREKDGAFVRFLRDRSKKKDERFEDPNAFERDFQIDLAEKLLAKTDVESGNRKQLIEAFKPVLESSHEQQLRKLRKLLAQRFDVDWSSGPSPESAKLKMNIETKPDGPVRAGETLTIEATVTNRGDAPLYRTKA
ncbi:MAG: MXAN_5808 family serine peptidase, partial [Bradymonadaceae bacterium]